MKEVIGKLQINKFYIFIYLGIFLMFISVQYDISFLENKNLFGLSMGVTIMGLSILLGKRKDSLPTPSGIFSYETTYFGKFLWGMFLFGLIVSAYFMIKIIVKIL